MGSSLSTEYPQPEGTPEPKPQRRGTFTAAIDQGTTSSRFLIFNEQGIPQASHQLEFEQLYPHSG